MSVALYILTDERKSQSMNLRRKFIFELLLQRIDIPSFGYNLTKIKPYINTYCTYTDISPWPAIVTEKVLFPPPPEAQHVTEKECEVTNKNVDNYQYRTVSSISIALDFKFIVKLS